MTAARLDWRAAVAFTGSLLAVAGMVVALWVIGVVLIQWGPPETVPAELSRCATRPPPPTAQ